MRSIYFVLLAAITTFAAVDRAHADPSQSDYQRIMSGLNMPTNTDSQVNSSAGAANNTVQPAPAPQAPAISIYGQRRFGQGSGASSSTGEDAIGINTSQGMN